MALVVEDGSGLTTAEAYISVAAADAYFADRGNTAWAALTSTAKEQALRAGADYMQAVYGGAWVGCKLKLTQALDWPRTSVLYPAPIPAEISRANAELALRAATGSLLADQGAQVTSETVGPVSVTYAPGARQSTRYAFVDSLVQRWMSGGGALKVARA
ncbi:DnaT-like ssDNA-binding protein [Lysobacter sp. HA35]